MTKYNGLDLSLHNLARISEAETRSICGENLTGEKGKGGMSTDGVWANAARELGQGWKVSPHIYVKPNSSFTLAEIEGPGAIQHIWITCEPKYWRVLILRFYWDGEENPSVEVPFGDFFANGWCEWAPVNSIPIVSNSAGAMNSYWLMPFRKSAKVEIENLSGADIVVFYQITYTLTSIPDDMAYFHASWNRSNPLKYKEVHNIIDEIKGVGHYIGTYLAWQSNNCGWWGEGEIKFYMDGDKDFPTICGTGTEDYVGGAWSFNDDGEYKTYSTPYLGFHQHIKPNGHYRSQTRFGMYRWHVLDPIRFKEDLKVTIQALSWRSEGRLMPLQDDIASVAYWYQIEPHNKFTHIPDRNFLEV